VNDVHQLKQLLIKVWSGIQQQQQQTLSMRRLMSGEVSGPKGRVAIIKRHQFED